MTDNPHLPAPEHKDDFSPILENKFINLIETGSGIVFDDIKRRELKKNVFACMQEVGENSFHRYYDSLISGEPGGLRLKKLINFITINETFFFRVEEHFQILRDVAVPGICEGKYPGGVMNIWSAGASSGEEVYSIIITLMEIPGLMEKYRIRFLGTDINDDMLYIAQNAVYGGRTIDKVPMYILNKYFTPFRDRRQVNEAVRKMADFRYLNLVEPFDLDFFGKPDIIFFRNVLIYFSRETTRKIIARFYELLNPGGFLFLGPSETLWDISDQFQLLMFDRAYIYRKPFYPGKQVLSGVAENAKLKNRITETPGLEQEETPVEIIPAIRDMTFPAAFTAPETDIFPSVTDKLRIKEEEASLALQLGDYRRAGELTDELLSLSQNSKSALLLKLTLLANQGDEIPLMAFAEKTIALHPIFPELHFMLGRFHESRGNYREAEKEHRKILFLNQELLPARARLLGILIARGDVANARREAKNILEQLAAGNFRDFLHPVGESLNVESIKKLCFKALS